MAESTKAAPITVFVILMQLVDFAWAIREDIKVGAVYWNEQEAKDEVARLLAANGFLRATYVSRQIEAPRVQEPPCSA